MNVPQELNLLYHHVRKNNIYVSHTHHYDHPNTFWDRARPQQNNNSHCLKQFYVIIGGDIVLELTHSFFL